MKPAPHDSNFDHHHLYQVCIRHWDIEVFANAVWCSCASPDDPAPVQCTTHTPQGSWRKRLLGKTAIIGHRGHSWKSPEPKLQPDGIKCTSVAWIGKDTEVVLNLSFVRLYVQCVWSWSPKVLVFVLRKTLTRMGSYSGYFILFLAAAGYRCINAMAGIIEVVTLWDKS